MSKKRIGILTSGGDCPGLNAVIRGTVKASHQLGYDCVGFIKGYEGLYDPVQYVHLSADSTRGILNQGGTILGSTNKGRFAATVGVDNRKELDPQLVEGVKQTIDQLGIDGLICVGGDGSLAVAQQFHEQGIPVVGVPKTIDNDLSATAFTFGFDSAIECATDALDRLHTTGSSHERIMVLEVMGRHAGWIALHSGIAGGGDIILLPEIPWTWDHLCHKILHRESQGKKFTLVVVAEGAELPGGELVGEQRDGQQMKLGGVGRTVTNQIEQRLHREARLCVLGHLQRGGKPTTFDRVLATQFGAHAVRLVHEGRFGEMICSRPPEMTSVPIIEAVNELRRVDPHGPAVQAARALGISFGDRPADEIGQNIFDGLEPVAHVADLVANETPSESVAEAPAPINEPVAAPEQVVEAPVVACEATPPEAKPEAAIEPVPTSSKVAATEEADLTVPEPDEDEAVEAVAETLLDLVAEADTAAHGTEEPEVETPSTGGGEAVEDPREVELPETDQLATETAPDVLESEVASGALELEEDTPALPEIDLSAAQSQLADRIAEAAQATRDAVPNTPAIDVTEPDLSVADLVKQKLAAATEAAKPTLDAPADQPHDEDLVAEARSALEEALAD